MTGHEFYLNTINRQFDMDNSYGYQCWDLFAYFCTTMEYNRINCGTTGYVIDIWNDRNWNGMLDNFNVIEINNIKDGDWLIFDFGNISHIAMFRRYEGSNGIFLGQNQGVDFVNQKIYSLDNVVGAFRAKDMEENEENKVFKATVITDILNVRNYPSLAGDIMTTYEAGETFYFTKRLVNEGYTWATYTSFDGNTRYVALCENYVEDYCKVD